MRSGRQKELRWLNAALDDLSEIVDHIAGEAPQAAQRFAESVFARVERLRRFPYLRSICPHYGKARQLVHGNYIVYYTVHRKEIVIRAVVHGARLFRSYWLRRED